MSRSNPKQTTQHICRRWLEWSGKKGSLSYWDTETAARVDLGDKLTFLLLDETSSVRGWHDASGSGIYSNEVRDTREQPLVVKAFKGGVLAEGLYAEIRDRVNAAGGEYNANLYCAIREGDDFTIACIHLKGTALGAWMDYKQALGGKAVYEKACTINGSVEGKKGSVTFKVPKFGVRDVSPETNDLAKELDQQLQAYFDEYFAAKSQAQPVAAITEPEPEPVPANIAKLEPELVRTDDDDVPF